MVCSGWSAAGGLGEGEMGLGSLTVLDGEELPDRVEGCGRKRCMFWIPIRVGLGEDRAGSGPSVVGRGWEGLAEKGWCEE